MNLCNIDLAELKLLESSSFAEKKLSLYCLMKLSCVVLFVSFLQ